MHIRAGLLIIGSITAGCAAHDGTYEPGCTAFAGTTVELHGDRFVVDRFTDAVEVDADGNVVDKYPEFPKQGAFDMYGDRLEMTTDSGERLDSYYLHKHAGDYLLLTSAEQAAWENDGRFADCALTRNTE